MTEYVGGLRLRLIKSSFYYMLQDSMNELGWFNGSNGSRFPVKLLAEQADTKTEIKPNIVAISTEDMDHQDMEMGSNLAENTWKIYIDILAEDEAVGLHLAGDIYDVLRGKISAVGRTRASLEVKDLPPNNDTTIFTCQLDGIILHRVRDWDRAYNKYWWIVACDIIDTYYDDQL